MRCSNKTVTISSETAQRVPMYNYTVHARTMTKYSVSVCPSFLRENDGSVRHRKNARARVATAVVGMGDQTNGHPLQPPAQPQGDPSTARPPTTSTSNPLWWKQASVCKGSYNKGSINYVRIVLSSERRE